MSYFFIARIRINDESEYQKYIDKSETVFKKYKGEYLAVENEPLVLEGSFDYSRLVLIRFNNRHDFEIWYNSADYQEILKHRLRAADCDTNLIKGFDDG